VVIASHPELADRLRAFFADLDRLGSRGEAFRLPDLSLPEDFGDYEFLEEVGRGGVGQRRRTRTACRDVSHPTHQTSLFFFFLCVCREATSMKKVEEKAVRVVRGAIGPRRTGSCTLTHNCSKQRAM
jgi:hypothetical protein